MIAATRAGELDGLLEQSKTAAPPETAETKPGIDSPFFSLTVTRGDMDTLQFGIPADALADLIRSLPDRPEFLPIFNLAARHPAARVRLAACYMENLSRECIRLLADDPCAEVRRQLISSKALVRHADTDQLLRLAASDPGVAEMLSEYLHDFTGCNVDRVERALAAHSDSAVRLYLAQNGEVSLRTLTLLSSDADPGVAATAIRQTQARLGTTHDLRHRN